VLGFQKMNNFDGPGLGDAAVIFDDGETLTDTFWQT
jgi:hypothetical protein